MSEPKWLYQYDGRVQRIQIGLEIEDGSSIVEINANMRLHLGHEDGLIAVEIRDDAGVEWE